MQRLLYQALLLAASGMTVRANATMTQYLLFSMLFKSRGQGFNSDLLTDLCNNTKVFLCEIAVDAQADESIEHSPETLNYAISILLDHLELFESSALELMALEEDTPDESTRTH